MTVLGWVVVVGVAWMLTIALVLVGSVVAIRWFRQRAVSAGADSKVASPYGALPAPTDRELRAARSAHLPEELRKLHSNHPWR